MNLSDRAKAELERILLKLGDDIFDEDDIRKLLLHLRANFKSQRLIWEFASFVAHPEERDRGVFHQDLDVKYAKIKYVHANNGQTKLNIQKIEETVFKTLIKGSLEKYSERDLVSKIKRSKKDCTHLIKQTYKKEGQYYFLRAEKISDIGLISSIIRVIISTIEFKHALNINELFNQFNFCFKKLVSQLQNDFDYKSFLKKDKDKLALCLMSLIHSSKFRLFDGAEGVCELSLSKDIDEYKKGVIQWHLNLDARVTSENKSTFTWSLMELTKDVSSFVPELVSIAPNNFQRVSPSFFNAIRNEEGNLILGKKT